MIEISKTYTISYQTMSEAQWEALAEVYAQLPKFLGYGEPDRCPAWFGWAPKDRTDPTAVYLSASVEPSGLLVEGQLPAAIWEAWDRQFMTLASQALGFSVRDAED